MKEDSNTHTKQILWQLPELAQGCHFKYLGSSASNSSGDQDDD